MNTAQKTSQRRAVEMRIMQNGVCVETIVSQHRINSSDEIIVAFERAAKKYFGRGVNYQPYRPDADTLGTVRKYIRNSRPNLSGEHEIIGFHDIAHVRFSVID